MFEAKKQSDLLIYYLDYVRNYKQLTEEMIENISTFNNQSKMMIIKEFNNSIKLVNELFNDD